MALDRDAYREVLIALLPRGRVWELQPVGWWWKLLDALAEGYARIHADADQLLIEADPRTTYELLPDFERALGLPDLCGSDALSITDRRAAVIARLTALGDPRPDGLIQQAEAMGYRGATIDEYEPASCESSCEDHLFDEPWLFTFTLNLPQEPDTLGATCDGSCEDYLGMPPNNRIECLINRIKPSHTYALFTYTGA